jgi:PmbA protein
VWFNADVTLRDEGDKRPEGGSGGGARHRADAPSAAWVGEDALARARARLASVRGPTARTVMVVDPRAAGRLIGSLLSGTGGESIHQGRSHWVGKLDQPVISPLLTVTDDPHLVRGFASRLWDGEGLATKPRTVIEGGALKTYFLDTTYARKLKMQPTTGSSSNRVVGLGSQDLAALVAAAGDGILVTSWLGGNMNPATGDFSYGIRGHRVEGGKVGQPIGETNITGNVLALFASLRAVGNDPWPYSSTKCPTLVFDGVQFS